MSERSFAFDLGYKMQKRSLGLLGGAATGAGIGGIVGAVEDKDDDKSRIMQILKRVLQGGAIGGAAGAVHTHGRLTSGGQPHGGLERGFSRGLKWEGA